MKVRLTKERHSEYIFLKMMEQEQSGRRILLIDDDPVTNMITTKIIQKSFTFQVTAFTNAEEALVQLKQWSTLAIHEFPQVIFLDINMPIMDGWEFLEEFQKFSTVVLDNCKVIMLSSSIDIEDIEKSRTFKSVREFVSKPLTQEKVRNLL